MNPLFSGLGADSINKIAAMCHTHHLAAGEILFQKATAGMRYLEFDGDRFASRRALLAAGG
jgi:hypothetical protein